MTSDEHPLQDVSIILNSLKDIASAVMYAAKAGTVEQVLERIAQVSSTLVKARYGALGVPDGKGGLKFFKVAGMTPEQIRHIQHLPLGKGLLGAVMSERQPLRLERMSDDPRSSGFCAAHPKMTSFLGVPIQAAAQLLGILYLCDRIDGQPFNEEDQWLAETMAGYAALAIAGAQLSEQQSRVNILEERERIGMELHDGVIQSLYAIGMHLDLIRTNEHIHASDFKPTIDNLNIVIEDIRRYILNLGATNVKTIYICLRDLLDRLHIPSSIHVEIDAPDEPPPFRPATFEAICQIANEAISNAVRHANAHSIKISTHQDLDLFQIVITDDGQGFDLEQMGAHEGLGLRNIQQRAYLYSGHVHIETAAGSGTRLTITIPVRSI
jgi:signal transduction histidine kinase